MHTDPLVELTSRLKDALENHAEGFVSDEGFNGWLRRIFGAQFESNPMVRAWAEARSILPSEELDWTRVPALPTTAFKEADVSCIPKAMRTTVFHSSGTTGQEPSRHPHCAKSLGLYETSLRRGFVNCTGLENPPCLWSLTPTPLEAPHSSLAHMMATLASAPCSGTGRFWGRSSDEGWLVETDAVATALGGLTYPILLCGTAFNFVHLLDAFPGRRWNLPSGSYVLETGGYKGRSRELPRSDLHGSLATAFGLPQTSVLTEYGMSELSSPAYSVPRAIPEDQAELVFPPWTRTRIVSPETGRTVAEGEVGLLEIIDLANLWSSVAIQTADLARRDGGRVRLIGRASRAEPRGCSLMST